MSKKISYQDFLKSVADGKVKTASDSLNHTARKKNPKKKKTLEEPAPPAGKPYGYFEMKGKRYQNKGNGWKELTEKGPKNIYKKL